jgi:hypothetical protein
MTNLKKFSLLFLLLTLSSNVLAFDVTVSKLTEAQKKSLTIGSVEIQPVETDLNLLDEENVFDKGVVELPKVPTNPLDEISIIIDGLLAIGKKVWPIIEAGKPVINNKLAPAVSILPTLKNPSTGVLYEMANWSVPKAQSFRVSFKNLFKSEVVGFTYTVLFQYNGSYQGVGKYVTTLKVLASNIYVAWGFDFDANSELIGIANVGTSEEPVASGIIGVNYSVKGILNESRSAESVYVDGLGRMQVVKQ